MPVRGGAVSPWADGTGATLDVRGIGEDAVHDDEDRHRLKDRRPKGLLSCRPLDQFVEGVEIHLAELFERCRTDFPSGAGDRAVHFARAVVRVSSPWNSLVDLPPAVRAVCLPGALLQPAVRAAPLLRGVRCSSFNRIVAAALPEDASREHIRKVLKEKSS